MRSCAIAICFLTAAAATHADEPAAWTRGVEFFAAGSERMRHGNGSREQFRRAADEFSQVAREHPRRAEAYLNAGKTYYLAGQLPEAIAAFHQGLAIDPSEGRLQDCLAHVRRDVTLPADSRLSACAGAWQRHLIWPRLNDVAIGAAIAACLTLPAGLRGRRRRLVVVGSAALAIVAMAGLAIFVRATYLADMAAKPVEVVREDTAFRVGNSEGFETHPETPLLPRGYEVGKIGERGGWLHVACPGGQVGWVPAASVVSWR